MIYGLYKFLNGQMLEVVGLRMRNIWVIFAFGWYYGIATEIKIYWIFGVFVGLLVIYTGFLNHPYFYLWNAITILINKTFFKKRIFISNNDKKLKFRKKKEYWFSTDNPIGIILDDVVHIDDYYKKSSKILFFPNVNYMEDFDEFISQLDNKDTMGIIKRKLILHKL